MIRDAKGGAEMGSETEEAEDAAIPIVPKYRTRLARKPGQFGRLSIRRAKRTAA